MLTSKLMLESRLFIALVAIALGSACTIVTENPDDDERSDDDSANARSDSSGGESEDDDDAGVRDQDSNDDAPSKLPAREGGVDARPTGNDSGTADEDDVVANTSSGEGGAGRRDPDAPETAVVEDPAPDAQAPGEYGCDGCPDGDFDDFEVVESASSREFSGVVTDAEGNGQFYIESPNGEAVSGPIPTDESGSFAFTAPLFCGVQTVKGVWSNEQGAYVLVFRVTREDCIDADIRLTLSWDDLGRDYELHLIKPEGRINDPATDCTWTSCISSSPDWGVQGDPSDDPLKDVDDTGDFGPENIFLANPEPGTYSVMVEHWSSSGDAASDGEITLNVAGETTVANVTDLPPHFVWNVGTITWPSGVVTLDGELIDCTGSWSSGCTLDLP